ncbi:hypothetical protein CXB51_032257 [Gossypium anomalum]|uniref:Uncharacterized protein n=1 Tax=Gossypium anomalum TaxID=47600 RepID=A0A8J5YDJ6_9ROSI|nr:hypothetical protein CXB51_032257 [Gossypium anomalum]
MFLSPLSLKSFSSFFFWLNNLFGFFASVCSVWILHLSTASFFYFLQLEEQERLPTVIHLTGVKLSPILYISSNGELGVSEIVNFSDFMLRFLYLLNIGNEVATTRILARQVVRLRQQITNLQGSCAQIRGVATHTQALYANTSIFTGMKAAAKAMVAMNKIEMMSEAIDETLDKDEADEETEELINQVFDEIGVDIASQLSSALKGRIASKNAAPLVNVKSKPTTDVDDLKKRLASLRRL